HVHHAGWAEAVGQLVSLAVPALIAETGGLVADQLLRECRATVVTFHGAEPAVHSNEAVDLAVGVGNERYRALPDQLVGVGAALAIETRSDRECAVGVMEKAGVGAAAVDDRGPVEVVGLVDHAGAVGPGQ